MDEGAGSKGMVEIGGDDNMNDTAKGKPEWWPECPYSESVFPMTKEEYVCAIPDTKLRTAISGFMGRFFWNLAADEIWKAMQEDNDAKL